MTPRPSLPPHSNHFVNPSGGRAGRFHALAFAVWGAWALAAGAAWAQDSPSAEPDTSYRAGDTEPPTIALSLEQAQRLATDNSPAGQSALADLRSARGARMREAGSFDPALFAGGSRVSTDSPPTSPFAASELRQRNLSGGASWLSPIGTALTFSLDRTTIETNAPFTTLPRERRAGARLDFVQPLLKGFGLAAARGELRALDRELDAAERRYDAATLAIAADVENSYWDLFATERDLGVARLQRQRSAIFLRDQVLRGRAGVVGPGAVAAARTLHADQIVALLDARLRLDAASDRLSQAMGISPGSQQRIHSAEAPPAPSALDPLEAVIARAFDGNDELAAAEHDSAAARARLRRAARNAWPTVEAFGGYGGSGLAGTGRPVVFGSDTTGSSFDTGFGEAWDQVWGDDFPDWTFGIRLSMPIGWRSDRGELLRQRAEYERASSVLRARRLTLESEVREAYREVQASGQTLPAMRQLVEAAREQARVGRLEYQTGRATAYDVVGLEADLARAELRETQVLVRVQRAQVQLRRLTQSTPGRTP